MRTCPKCKKAKDQLEFYKSKTLAYCKLCHKLIAKIYREDNREKIRAKDERYREAHRDLTRIRVKSWQENNREKSRKASKAWSKANPERVQAKLQKRRVTLMGLEADLTAEEWLDVRTEMEGRCLYCGSIATVMDHIVPLNPRSFREIGIKGRHTKSNVVLACKSCNAQKSDGDPLLFLFALRASDHHK